MATATDMDGQAIGRLDLLPEQAVALADLPVASSSSRRDEYRCECGHVLRVLGVGRHRVYFELGDMRLDDPVMNRACPECGRGLPGKNLT